VQVEALSKINSSPPPKRVIVDSGKCQRPIVQNEAHYGNLVGSGNIYNETAP
jgi:hypothetical protein